MHVLSIHIESALSLHALTVSSYRYQIDINAFMQLPLRVQKLSALQIEGAQTCITLAAKQTTAHSYVKVWMHLFVLNDCPGCIC